MKIPGLTYEERKGSMGAYYALFSEGGSLAEDPLRSPKVNASGINPMNPSHEHHVRARRRELRKFRLIVLYESD